MLVAVDKPHWITSYDVIRKLKPLYPKQKIWHSWTLDPFATWLMLIGIDKDTKRLTELTWLDKSYIATIDFSQDSDTRDLQYRDWIKNVLEDKKDYHKPTLEEIEEKLNNLIPSLDLPLTPFSAKKKDGKKLYELAREGKVVNEFRIMNTNSYKIIEYKFPILKIQLDVWSWTYIRSIAHRLWLQFNLWWILKDLRRTSIWKYDITSMDMKLIEWTEIKFCEVL